MMDWQQKSGTAASGQQDYKIFMGNRRVRFPFRFIWMFFTVKDF